MNFKILTLATFDRQAKRLAKKYPSLKAELAKLAESLSISPSQGIALGRNCFKIRVAIGSKSKGKSGGARIITHVYIAENRVYLLSIYDKSEQNDITDKELKLLLHLIEKNS